MGGASDLVGRRGVDEELDRQMMTTVELLDSGSLVDVQELSRRLEVALRDATGLGGMSLEVVVVSVAEDGAFVCDLRFTRPDFTNSSWERFLNKVDWVYLVPGLDFAEEGVFKVRVLVAGLEKQLVDAREPAGLHLGEEPLEMNDITPARLRWVQKSFSREVSNKLDGISIVFQSIRKRQDGDLEVVVTTGADFGVKRLKDYVYRNSPLGFSLAPRLSKMMVMLRISFEDFKKLLPSSVVDDGRAEIGDEVDGVVE